jgi:hypothetical protein
MLYDVHPLEKALALTDSNNIDIETLRQSRWLRILAPVSELYSRLFHLHWSKVRAEVIDCTPIAATKYPILPEDGWMRIGGYTVTFSYSVGGRTYKGLTESSFKVATHDTFPIRYNPRHPEENNTLGSTNSRASLFAKFLTPILALLILFLFIKACVFRR